MKIKKRKGKVFGVGLAKTGTTSLNDAFAILGLRTKGCPHDIKTIRRYDAATDGIVADVFEELDRVYPGSKFIYTIRDKASWLESCRNYGDRKTSRMPGHDQKAKRLYGTLEFDREILSKAYDDHDSHVRSYFRDRPDALLILNLCEGQTNWDQLCAFLGRPSPDVPFPRSNEGYSDMIFRYLLSRGRSPEEISSVTRARLDYLQKIPVDSPTMKELLGEPPRKRTDKVLVAYTKHFGSIAKAARALELPKSVLKAARQRHRQRKRLTSDGILSRVKRAFRTSAA